MYLPNFSNRLADLPIDGSKTMVEAESVGALTVANQLQLLIANVASGGVSPKLVDDRDRREENVAE